MREDAALHLLRRAVAAHLEEALLVVHNKQGHVVFVNALVGECHFVVWKSVVIFAFTDVAES